MSPTDLRPRLHLIGLAGIALIGMIDAVDAWHRWRHLDPNLQRKLAVDLTSGPVATPDSHPGLRAFEAPACDCTPTQLEADIFQAGEGHWNWRIYTMGCDEVPSEYALGTSDSLDEAQAHVLETMAELLDDADYELGELDFRVLHHVCAEVR